MDLGSLLVLLKLAGDMEFTVSPKTNGLPPSTKKISCLGMTPGSPAHIQCLIEQSKLGLK
jgi:hypothetical protein